MELLDDRLTDQQRNIVSLWNGGSSATEIATALDLTRNTVIGIVSRLREKGFEVVTKAKKPQPMPKAKKDPRPKLKPAPKIDISLFLPPGARPIIDEDDDQIAFSFPSLDDPHPDISQLSSRSCRYIVGNDRQRGALYCGDTISYRSYCEQHAQICYFIRKKDEATGSPNK